MAKGRTPDRQATLQELKLPLIPPLLNSTLEITPATTPLDARVADSASLTLSALPHGFQLSQAGRYAHSSLAGGKLRQVTAVAAASLEVHLCAYPSSHAEHGRCGFTATDCDWNPDCHLLLREFKPVTSGDKC